ncbi:aminotransferase class V-fold PLP-dependent enzyme [Zobellia uliginosa]|uniref:aminotransferase class V-fold PLP-dependent enzyme n=1 Tax=Zobellia uliginosa TaxID=143224 RepID=UPI0026E447C6|nr:aminotransferase class V-fold PLP-dependent enzyme [Zobellia uliginosa]MDO6519094.1 aminotransferase class V-fold PLP-dependent enzyme [Zobellia uliginosa]
MVNTRKHFPVLSQYIYANTASAGLLNDDLMEWRQEHDMDYLIGGSNFRNKVAEKLIGETRETVAGFFGAKADNTALVQNFTLGLNMLLEGLDKKERVLLVKDDYPSVNWPFEYRGFPVSYVALSEDLEADILHKLRAEDISVLALSLVQWTNGFKINMKILSKIKEEFPNLKIIADGTQYCGTCDFDFESSPIDVLGASAYKWLLSGYGNGFMLFKDGVQDMFSVKTIGFNGSGHDLGARDKLSFARHFEPGHLDTLTFGSMKFSLDYLTKLGKGAIEERLQALSRYAMEGFGGLGILSDDIVKRKEHSTIFNIQGNDALFQELTEYGVLCSLRGKGIRLSFHFYNNEEDIDEVLRILKTVL